MPDERPRWSLRYLPALDGLRALAVVAVIGYHADLAGTQGGFLGVELFFVVSGFLITSLLLAERRAGHGIDLIRFWARRARRLLPALGVVVLAVAVVTRVFLPEEAAGIRGDLVSATTYSTNWYFVATGRSYFQAVGRPSMLQHVWSLAIEEQYYLVWPLVVLGLTRLGGRRALAIGCAVGVVASTTAMWVLVDVNAPSRVYYGTDTRAAALLIGSLLATTLIGLRAPHGEPGDVGVTDIIGALALLGVALSMWRTSEYSPALYHAGFLRFSLLTAVVIFAVTIPGSRLARALAARPLVAVGRRSYSLYLWHWPVFELTRPGLDWSVSGPTLLMVRLGLTAGLAELSYRFVEQPFRDGRVGAWLRRRREDPILAVRTRRAGLASASFLLLIVVGYIAVAPTPRGDFRPLSVSSPKDLPRLGTAVMAGPTTPTTTTAPITTTAPTTRSSAPTGPTKRPAATTTTAAPTTTAPPVTMPTVHAIGDSVMLRSRNILQATFGPGSTIDAVVGRQPDDGADLAVHWLAAHRRDREPLIVHLGNNGILRPDTVEKIMDAAGTRRVVFLTVDVPRRWEGPSNDALKGEVPKFRRARLLDWKALVQRTPGLLEPDGIHPNERGATAYTTLIVAALA